MVDPRPCMHNLNLPCGGAGQFILEWSGFGELCATTLGPNDAVIVVVGTEHTDAAMIAEVVAMASVVTSSGAKLGMISVGTTGEAVAPAPLSSLCTGAVHLELPAVAPAAIRSIAGRHGNFLAEIGVKLVLNAVTTGGHIMKGKIFGNRMVDLQVSNNKLFYRTIGIVAACSGGSDAAAHTAVLRALYGVDEVTAAHQAHDISRHVVESAAAIMRGVSLPCDSLMHGA
jgi:hypothetical protein